MTDGIETSDHGVLARYSVRLAIHLRHQHPTVQGDVVYLQMRCLSADPVDKLMCELIQGQPGVRETPLRADLLRIVERDQWSSVGPCRIGYEDENELAFSIGVRDGSMTPQRAAAVAREAHEVLARCAAAAALIPETRESERWQSSDHLDRHDSCLSNVTVEVYESKAVPL